MPVVQRLDRLAAGPPLNIYLEEGHLCVRESYVPLIWMRHRKNTLIMREVEMFNIATSHAAEGLQSYG